MEVSASGYADWCRGGARHKRLTDTHLLKLIEEIHRRVMGGYGSPRMYDEIKDAGYPVSQGRIERLMRENVIRARHMRRYKATTDSGNQLTAATNLLNRQFNSATPREVYTADVTYIDTSEGWLYLTLMLDLFDRSIVR